MDIKEIDNLDVFEFRPLTEGLGLNDEKRAEWSQKENKVIPEKKAVEVMQIQREMMILTPPRAKTQGLGQNQTQFKEKIVEKKKEEETISSLTLLLALGCDIFCIFLLVSLIFQLEFFLLKVVAPHLSFLLQDQWPMIGAVGLFYFLLFLMGRGESLGMLLMRKKKITSAERKKKMSFFDAITEIFWNPFRVFILSCYSVYLLFEKKRPSE